jgi:hypothetical protein
MAVPLNPVGSVPGYVRDRATGKVYSLAVGTPGVGVPPGGATGDKLVKASASDYDTRWESVATSDPMGGARYGFSVYAGTDPGSGYMGIRNDGGQTRTLAFSKTDMDGNARNLAVFQPGDTLTVTDDPTSPPVTNWVRYALLTLPVDRTTWWEVSALRTDVAGPGRQPAPGEPVLVYGTPSGSSVRSLDDLDDVDLTTTLPTDGVVLTYSSGLWVPGAGGGGTDEVAVLGTEPTDPAIELWVDTATTLPPGTGGPIALDDLTDVVAPAPVAAGLGLVSDGTNWTPQGLVRLTGDTMTGQLKFAGDAWDGANSFITFTAGGVQMLLVYNQRLGFNCADKQPQVFKSSYNTRVDIVDTQTGDARYAPKVLADSLFTAPELAFCDPAGLRDVKVTDAVIDGEEIHLNEEGWALEAVLRGLVLEVRRLRAESDDLRARLADVLDPEE